MRLPSSLISRGDVFDVDLPEVGLHPCVVATLQKAIPVRTNVTVLMVTSKARGRPTEIPLDTESGLDHPSVVACDEIYTVPKRSLDRKRSVVPVETMLRIDGALRPSLGLL